PWLLARALHAPLALRRGTIVNISSTAGRDGSPRLAAYAASKAGLINLTRTLSREWADDGIRVHCVTPGLIDAGLSAGLTDEQRARLLAPVPLARAGRPDEVAPLVL